MTCGQAGSTSAFPGQGGSKVWGPTISPASSASPTPLTTPSLLPPPPPCSCLCSVNLHEEQLTSRGILTTPYLLLTSPVTPWNRNDTFIADLIRVNYMPDRCISTMLGSVPAQSSSKARSSLSIHKRGCWFCWVFAGLNQQHQPQGWRRCGIGSAPKEEVISRESLLATVGETQPTALPQTHQLWQ